MTRPSAGWRRLIGGLTLLVVALVLVVFVRAWRVDSRQIETQQVAVDIPEAAPETLARALQYETITKRQPAELDSSAFAELYGFLEEAFPDVHTALDVEPVNGLSRLYKWEGRNPSLRPIVLMAHVDVVPIEDSSAWRHDPFGGRRAGGHVWGRGALDDKSSAVGILQAIELLLDRGITPNRTIYVALGHDEEVGGRRGGRVMANRITSDGTTPALVVDEGGAITRGALPGLDDPLAVIGVAGKGYLTVEIEAKGPGGHSSVPPNRTSIELLNRALSRLTASPLSSKLTGVTGTLFDYVAPEVSLPMRTLFANRWLTAPALRWVLNQRPATRAAIRTTMAPTRLRAGIKDNVIPTSARAVVNFRILPSQSVASVVAHVESTLEGLPVTVSRGQSSSPTTVSEVEGDTFEMLQRTVGQVTADSVVVAPFLVPGTTDSRYYADDSDHVYRFVPYTLTPEDRSRIHGVNERISVDDYRTVVQFYVQLVRNADRLPED